MYSTHFKFVFRGVFINTPEQWSFSAKFSRDNPAGADASYGDIDDGAVTSALATFIGGGRFNVRTRATGWRAYQIGTDGLTEGNPLIVELESGSQPTGTGSSTIYPPDVALCITSEAENRGHARFGRLYLPGPATALASDMRLSPTDALDYAEWTSTFLKSVSNAIDLEGLQSSAMLNVSNDATGTRQEVRNLRCGRTLDRISRRRRQMLEDYEVTGTIDW